MGIGLSDFASAADTRADRFRRVSFEFDLLSGNPCTSALTADSGIEVTDQDVLNEIQHHVIEIPDQGQTFQSGLWTVQEVIDYFNQRYRQFLKDTLILMSRQTLETIPENQRHPLPQDWIVTQRVVWHDSDPNSRTFDELPRTDGFEMDHGFFNWQRNEGDKPRFYQDAELPTLEIQTAPQASNAGILEIIYVALGEILSNTGVVITMPIEFIPAIKWGVIADMLGKVGRGLDPERSAHAESRYQEGVAAARLILSGWM